VHVHVYIINVANFVMSKIMKLKFKTVAEKTVKNFRVYFILPHLVHIPFLMRLQKNPFTIRRFLRKCTFRIWVVVLLRRNGVYTTDGWTSYAAIL